MGRIRPYNKHDPIIGRDLTAAERLEPARAAIRYAVKLLKQTIWTLDRANDHLTEEQLQTICEAVDMAEKAAENVAFMGSSGFNGHPLERINWKEA